VLRQLSLAASTLSLVPPGRSPAQTGGQSLQTTFSDKNGMRQSAPVRVRGGGSQQMAVPTEVADDEGIAAVISIRSNQL